MRIKIKLGATLFGVMMALAVPVAAQTSAPAPAAGSGGGGSVGASQTTPISPTGKTPPGTPTAQSSQGQSARNGIGNRVIGHTTTPRSSVPGNTGGQGTGTR